jgi:hypothetical protein
VADALVASIALRGVSEGVLADPLEFRAVFSITLIGDVNWTPIRALIQSAKDKWRGILYDEVSGFNASVD